MIFLYILFFIFMYYKECHIKNLQIGMISFIPEDFGVHLKSMIISMKNMLNMVMTRRQ